MGTSQFSRFAAIILALVALAIPAVWLADGVPTLSNVSNVYAGAYAAAEQQGELYVWFAYSGTPDEAARRLKQLAAAGYPADDAMAGTFEKTEHDLVLRKQFSQKDFKDPKTQKVFAQLRKSITGSVFSGPRDMAYLNSDLLKGRYSLARGFVFGMAQGSGFSEHAVLYAAATAVISTALLALLLLYRATATDAIRWLGVGLGCWSLSIGYLWLYSVVPTYAAYPPQSIPLRIVCDVAAMLLFVTASYCYVKFWRRFPQPVPDDELEAFLLALRRVQIEKIGWLRTLMGRKELAEPAQVPGSLKGDSELSTHPEVRRRKVPPYALAALAAVFTGMAWTGGWVVMPLAQAWVGISMFFAFMIFFLMMFWPGLICLRLFKYHRSVGSVEDCRKIEWIWASIWMSFVAVVIPLVLLAVLSVAQVFDESLYGLDRLAWTLFVVGLCAAPLLVILAVALSIFYRGSIDPRLALRGLTMWSVLGLMLTLVFVLVERSIAVRIARWWNLPPQTGYVTAGAVVAATFQPIRRRAEKHVTRFVERVMPATMLSSGTRRTLAVAVVDITGYTALSAKDEQSALVASALVQKEARRLADSAGGSVVKSTGDGVIMAFADAGKAIDAIIALHRSVRESGVTLNLPEISLHSGLHWGDIVEMRDGDIYGMTVNLAARLADWAKAGEIGVSQAFRAQLVSDVKGFEDCGPQAFKNVPEPLDCLKLKDA